MQETEGLISPKGEGLPRIITDFVVVGSGVAALRCALTLAKYGDVHLITKGKLVDSNTFEAQGGIAVPLSPDDSPEKHLEDTLAAGCGLSNPRAVEILVKRGREKVEELIEWGAVFDRENGKYHLSREGGHTRNRILHAGGDATGKEVARVLISRIMITRNITFHEFTFAVDLLVGDGKCIGLIAFREREGFMIFLSKAVILATGGAGQVFRETTNHRLITGDGIAMAWRAGVEVMDMEFLQFHPTSLYIAGTARLLISEAVRGEGGILVNKFGQPFMKNYHPDGDLAPRDVVSRSILEEMLRTESTHVYLDVSHLPYEIFRNRFPHILKACEDVGIDIRKEPIPVRPSAHYFIGGIRVDEEGRTSLPGLYACGECADSGLHGANRLASNSLLEGLVFGEIVGETVGNSEKEKITINSIPYPSKYPQGSHLHLDLEDVKMSLKSLMSRNVGIIRDEEKLQEAKERIDFWWGYIMNREFFSPTGWELQNMLIIARLMVEAAYLRKESRGVHYRKDYPEEKSEWCKHIVLKRGCKPIFIKGG
ncbi:MAG TPA: L-aspartate oxidase [bacterium]|nr:L-aspartate oxidase [bacterium]HEX67970.1 L-aspartate oxidase [bacterium]